MTKTDIATSKVSKQRHTLTAKPFKLHQSELDLKCSETDNGNITYVLTR